MTRKAILFLSLFLLNLVPSLSNAAEQQTAISADSVTVDSNNILTAQGNVVVSRGAIYIKAEGMKVYKQKKQIEFKNIEEFSDGDTIKIEGKKALLSSDLSNGIISAAEVLIDETMRIRAGQINIKNNTIDKATNIDRITSCEECENGVPLWYFTASSASNDLENRNIVYRDVVMRVAGVPVGYVPYLRLPSPDVKRAKGFLMPELYISSHLGLGLKLPYFVPINDSRDVLITPFLSPNTKTVEYRYRQKFVNGNFTLLGAYSKDEINNNKIRGYYQAQGNFQLGYGVELAIEAENSSDETYLSEYGYDFKDDLNSNVSVSKVLADKKRVFKAKLNYIRDEKEVSLFDEYYVITGEYIRRIEQDFIPGSFTFDISGNSALNVGRGNRVNRPPSSLAAGLQYGGIQKLGEFQISNGLFSRLSSFVNSEDSNSFDEEVVLQYGASSKLSFPMMNIKNDVTKVLTPNLMISYNEQKGRTNGDAFIGADELTVGNIFSSKKYSSLSESELGLSLSAGLEYFVSWANKQNLKLSFGSLWFEDATYGLTNMEGLSPNDLKFVGDFHYQKNRNISVAGRSIFSEQGKPLRGQLESILRYGDYQIFGGYEFISEKTDNRFEKDLENFELSSVFDVSENFKVDVSGRYDLAKRALAKASYGFGASYDFWEFKFNQEFSKQKEYESAINAIYNDNCTRIVISLKNTQQSLEIKDSIQSLSVTVQLKPFSSFSVPGL